MHIFSGYINMAYVLHRPKSSCQITLGCFQFLSPNALSFVPVLAWIIILGVSRPICTNHFVGDIGQPLYVEAFAVRSNDIDAVCDGK
ncbi:hypothetical protein F5050DRAFT_1766289 [Lentinula boryana]|uniref:Uncharacterized protein n=1 Tax=Lentinula boryana TaxID=40481 RepID=A0ABQ8QAP1_9AGAR|nr:hypothetical protein F5050DRAFT_1766289 [Lentinula boryana]